MGHCAKTYQVFKQFEQKRPHGFPDTRETMPDMTNSTLVWQPQFGKLGENFRHPLPAYANACTYLGRAKRSAT
jgi:hypothetical protein